MITLSFASLLLTACGGEKAPATDTDEVVEELSATIDSASVEIHQATEEIEKSTFCFAAAVSKIVHATIFTKTIPFLKFKIKVIPKIKITTNGSVSHLH